MPVKNHTPSRFILKGFTHDQGFRQFAFAGIEEDRVETQFTVRADLNLARAYGIQIQDLPLLCRELLVRRAVTEKERRLTFTEEDMRLHQADRLAAKAAAAQKRRAPSRTGAAENTGSNWRATPLNIQSRA